MIPAPLLTLLRYAIVYACGKLTAAGYSFFGFDGTTTDAIVQGLAMLLAAGMTGIGMWTSTVKRMIARLKAGHQPELVAAAADVPGVSTIHAAPALADAVPSDKVVATPPASP